MMALGLSLSACSSDKGNGETVLEETPFVQSEVLAEATPASAPAEDPQTADPHAGHSAEGYGSGTDPLEAPEIEHVFDFAPDDHIVGVDSAPVKMIIYASVTCPHCGNWFTEEWPILQSNYIDKGKVQVAFREVLTAPQQLSAVGFVVANCAPEDKYMDIVVHQMQNQKQTFADLEAGKGEAIMKAWTSMAGLETEEAVKTCFEDTSHSERFNRAGMRMTKAGMINVPGVIINGEEFKDHDKSIANMAAKLSP